MENKMFEAKAVRERSMEEVLDGMEMQVRDLRSCLRIIRGTLFQSGETEQGNAENAIKPNCRPDGMRKRQENVEMMLRECLGRTHEILDKLGG